jgi:hypothetical protein
MNISHFSTYPTSGTCTDASRNSNQDTDRIASLKVERLPFTVRPVHSEEDLEKALHIRHLAYARHMPDFASVLRTPEPDDIEADTLVLLAESKLDGSPLGTVRIQTNRNRPLNLEQSVALPIDLKDKSLLEVRRLAVTPGSPGRLVKMVLIKGCLMFSSQNQIEWAVLAARPPLDRSYEKIMFHDILDGRTFIPMPRENNVPHKVLGLEMETLEERATASNHPMVDFFFHTRHPDISLRTSGKNHAVAAVSKRADHKVARWHD